MYQEDDAGGLNVFLYRLEKQLVQELSAEKDQSLALRRAILALSFFTARYDHQITKSFVRYLLTEFKYLAPFFIDDQHPLLRKHNVRRQVSDDDVDIAVHKTLISSMMRKPLNVTEDLIGSGVHWPWDITASRYVGFFDIMGFQSFVGAHKDDHGHVVSVMEDMNYICQRAESIAGLLFPLYESIDYPGCWIRLVQFSDSILAVTRDTSEQSRACMSIAAQLIFNGALRAGISVRGGIAAGLLTCDFNRSIYFGQPIIDAYRLEESQAWHGVAYHHSTDGISGPVEQLPEEAPEGWLPATAWYDVPMKGTSGTAHMQVTSWPLLHDSLDGLDAAIEHLRIESDAKLMAYYQATRNFGHSMLREMGRG